MENIISEGILRIKGGVINSQISNRLAELKRQNKPIISLNIGEPDFNTYPLVSYEAIKAITDNDTHYPPMTGKVGLKDAIIKKMYRDYEINYEHNQVLVCSGAKQAIFNLFMTILNPGDEVILFKPYWFSYSSIIEFIGAKVILIDCNEDFSINLEDFEQKVTNKTKLVVINSPNNPSGYIYSKEEYNTIANVVRNNNKISVLTDDIYEYIVYDNETCTHFLDANKDLINRTYLVNGVSKAYAMTGWRVGYIVSANTEVMLKMAQFHVNSSGAVCTISQRAAIFALNEVSKESLKQNNDVFQYRRDLVVNRLNQIKGMSIYKPPGAFYLLPNCSAFIDKKTRKGKIIKNDVDFVMYLLEDYYVGVAPATIFGLPNHFRISYATSKDNLTIACDRIEKAVLALL